MEASNSLSHAKHVARVILLLVVGITVFMFGRKLLAPDTWQEHGVNFRYANLAEQMNKPVQHGGDAACGECHDDKLEEHAGASHQRVRCEVCHNTLASHVKDGDKAADMTVDRSQGLCLRCHRVLHARPSEFPQVDPRAHLDDQGAGLKDPCLDCHEAHSPEA